MKKKVFNIKTKLTSAARKIWRYYPVRNEIFARNLVRKRVRSSDNIYGCETCTFKGVRSEFDVDHIDPVVDPKKGFVGWSEKTGFKGWDEYYNRLFILANEGQLLCKACHSQKTLLEKEIRTITKKTIDKTNKKSVQSNKVNKNNLRKKNAVTSIRRSHIKKTKR